MLPREFVYNELWKFITNCKVPLCNHQITRFGNNPSYKLQARFLHIFFTSTRLSGSSGHVSCEYMAELLAKQHNSEAQPLWDELPRGVTFFF